MVAWNRSNGMKDIEQEQKQNGDLEQEQNVQNGIRVKTNGGLEQE